MSIDNSVERLYFCRMFSSFQDTIVALATAQGVGAIAVIRLSGREAISICNKVFYGKDITSVDSHTVHFGTIRNGEDILDEVLVSVFKGPIGAAAGWLLLLAGSCCWLAAGC